jgi:hypothetical protein
MTNKTRKKPATMRKPAAIRKLQTFSEFMVEATAADPEFGRLYKESMALEVNLRAVRELAGKTQVEAAKAAGMAQSDISEVERRDDHLVSTLRRYVEALGGKLQIVAQFGDKSLRLKGV